jgi:hypothetical protein
MEGNTHLFLLVAFSTLVSFTDPHNYLRDIATIAVLVRAPNVCMDEPRRLLLEAKDFISRAIPCPNCTTAPTVFGLLLPVAESGRHGRDHRDHRENINRHAPGGPREAGHFPLNPRRLSLR